MLVFKHQWKYNCLYELKLGVGKIIKFSEIACESLSPFIRITDQIFPTYWGTTQSYIKLKIIVITQPAGNRHVIIIKIWL